MIMSEYRRISTANFHMPKPETMQRGSKYPVEKYVRQAQPKKKGSC